MSVDCGGGVRSMAAVSRLVDLGVRRIAIGTALVRDPAFAERVKEITTNINNKR